MQSEWDGSEGKLSIVKCSNFQKCPFRKCLGARFSVLLDLSLEAVN